MSPDDICYDPRQAQGYRGEDEMRKAEHTPLPWKWRDDFKHIQGSPREGETYGESVTNYGGLAKPRTTGMANAALIIEAVNNYESLRAKLASAKKALEKIGEFCSGDGRNLGAVLRLAEVQKIARDALEGKP